MQINIRTLLLLFILAAVSCSKTEDDAGASDGRITVTIGSMPELDIESRTALDPDGITVKWAKGDAIALWAVDSEGTTRLDADKFQLWHYNATYNSAKFTADIAPMPEDTYTYYAISPMPSERIGTAVSYSIPSLQTGVFDGACDVMVATPVTAGALIDGDNTKLVNLRFTHKIHVLKIRIPENKMGLPVSSLELTFPKPVTGTMTVDATNPAAPAVLTDGDNVLTLDFAEPIDAGSTIFATIAPVEIDPADRIIIKAYSGAKESLPTRMPGKNFLEAHTTPIALTIPEQYRITRLRFSLTGDGTETLGEAVNNFTLTGPEGVDLGEGSNVRTFPVNDQNEYEIAYEGEFTDNLSNQPFIVSFDSESAVVSSQFTMPQLTADETCTIDPFSIPYLLYEDFSGCSDFSGSAATGNAAGVELSSKGLPGWYAGARSQGYAGTCANLQLYSNAGGPYQSRLNTCKLNGIKQDKTVSVKLVFNSDWKKNKSGSMKLTVGRSTGTNLNDAINNSTSITMDNNSSASRTNIPTIRTVTIPNMTNAEAISWKTNGANASWTAYFNYEDVFIDNIQVSIIR